MADRTWNAVDARLYEEMWSREAKLVFGVIIARSPNPYGVYDVPYFILHSMFTEDEINKALDELSSDAVGAIKLYRERQVVWIIKKWRREGTPNEKQQKGARNHIERGFIEVWKDYKKYYKGYLRGINGVSKGFPSDSDSDSDADTENLKKASCKIPPVHLKNFIEEILPDQKFNQPQLLKQIAALGFLVKDYGEDEVFAVLRWMRQDTEVRGNWKGWSAVFNSITRLREGGCQKYLNARGQYLAKAKEVIKPHHEYGT